MGKRVNGEGSIYRRKDGRWCASIHVRTDEGIKRKYVYAKTQKLVKEKLANVENIYCDDSSRVIVFQEWMMQWMEDYKRPMLKQTTYDNYILNIKKHIFGSEIGECPICDLTADMLQKYYNRKYGGSGGNKGLSARTVEYLHTIIGGGLKQAYKNELVQKNVNDLTTLPMIEKVEIEPLTLEEVRRLLVYVKEDEMYALIILEVYTGMRKGEILGLQWKNIDFDKKIVNVKTNLCKVRCEGERKNKYILMKPKTLKSVRQIPVNDDVIHALQSHKIQQEEIKKEKGGMYKDNDMVFARADGNFEDPREVLRRFHKLLERAGVRKCRFHDLRHTFASILINDGEQMKIVQELMGHSTITTTMDIYSHISSESKERTAKRLEDLIGH